MTNLHEALEAKYRAQADALEERRQRRIADPESAMVPDPHRPGDTVPKWLADTDPRIRTSKVYERALTAGVDLTPDPAEEA